MIALYILAGLLLANLIVIRSKAYGLTFERITRVGKFESSCGIEAWDSSARELDITFQCDLGQFLTIQLVAWAFYVSFVWSLHIEGHPDCNHNGCECFYCGCPNGCGERKCDICGEETDHPAVVAIELANGTSIYYELKQVSHTDIPKNALFYCEECRMAHIDMIMRFSEDWRHTTKLAKVKRSDEIIKRDIPVYGFAVSQEVWEQGKADVVRGQAIVDEVVRRLSEDKPISYVRGFAMNRYGIIDVTRRNSPPGSEARS